MGTGDHHNRDHPLEREIKAASTREPCYQRRYARGDRDHREPHRCAIGEVLGTRAGFLGAAHQLDHLCEIRLSSGASDAQRDRRFSVDRSTEYRIPGAFLDRLRLARQ